MSSSSEMPPFTGRGLPAPCRPAPTAETVGAGVVMPANAGIQRGAPTRSGSVRGEPVEPYERVGVRAIERLLHSCRGVFGRNALDHSLNVLARIHPGNPDFRVFSVKHPENLIGKSLAYLLHVLKVQQDFCETLKAG